MDTVREKRPIGKPASGEREQLIGAVRGTKPKMLTARYGSTCRWCGCDIAIGSIIAHSSLPGARYTIHSGCHAEAWLEGRS